MVQNEQQYPASVSLVLLTFIGLAFSAVALIFGRGAIRPFGVGAAIPLVWSSLWLTKDTELIEALFFSSEASVLVSLPFVNRILGSAILAGIAIGYLCVGFRWIIEPKRSDDVDATGRDST